MKMNLKKVNLEQILELEKKNELNGLFDVEHADYHDHRCPGISQSLLKEVQKSEKRAKRWLTQPDKSTEAMDFGSLVHAAAFEPETFRHRIISYPPQILVMTGKRGVIEMREAFHKENPNQIIADQDQIDRVSIMIEFLYSQERAIDLLRGSFETTFFWNDFGLLCRGRADCLNQDLRTIVDLKITKDASINGVKRTASELQYYLQAAYYLRGVNKAIGEHKFNNFISINFEQDSKAESLEDFKASLDISYTSFGNESMLLGESEIREALHKLKLCKETNSWPGYSSEVQNIEVNQWRFNRSSI